MRALILFTLLFVSFKSFAQLTFRIDDFSDEYYGKVHVADTSEVFYKGWVAVYEKGTNKQLIKVESDRLYFQLHNGKVKANILESPYGEQSLLIYDDFNFDGVKDFAISNGSQSCKGGPSFDIYLCDNGKFAYSKGFSRLANDYCGMFTVDAKKKRIHTMTKDGCCWHQYSEFMVENNEPKVLRIEEFDGYGQGHYAMVVTEQTWNGKQMEKKVTERTISGGLLSFEYGGIMFAFELENGKKLLFLEDHGTDGSYDIARYTFVDAKGKVELEYPDAYESRKFDRLVFTDEDGKNSSVSCSFSNGNAKYMVYDYDFGTSERKVGIKVTVNGKTYDMKGKPATAKYRLGNVVGYDNVIEKQ